MSEQLIRLPELLKLVPVSRGTIWRWHRAGKFPGPVRMGARAAWVRAEVDAWIAERREARSQLAAFRSQLAVGIRTLVNDVEAEIADAIRRERKEAQS